MKFKYNITIILNILFYQSIAWSADGTDIDNNYHITKPENQGVDVRVTLTEASALTLSNARKSLWTVSDSQENYVFKMELDGDAKSSESFEIINYPYDFPDLEGVTLSGDGQYMYLVQERDLAIIKVLVTPESDNAQLVSNVQLSSMANYSTKVEPYIGDDDNKGLEGIAYHTGTNDIFVMVEKVEQGSLKGPLIIRVNNAMNTIIDSKFLNGTTGFIGADGDTTIDGSGIDFYRGSPDQNRFYIVSDEGESLFAYDWNTNTAKNIKDLGYPHGEGVAFDHLSGNLYIVTDEGNNDPSQIYYYRLKR